MMENNKINDEKKIEQLEKQQKRDRKIKIILIIIIILLLIFYILGYRLGKIGYIYKETSIEPSETIKLITVTQEDMEIVKDSQLNIFENVKFDGEKKISPNSSGSYQFCVKNETKENIVYHLNFFDEMKHHINMKYRLKLDNVYIKGNGEKYIDISDLNVEEIIVLKDSINVFTLEWYWEDLDEEDTYVGSQKTDEYYTLKLEIQATKYEK